MLAAKDEDRFGWLVPFVFFIVYIVSAISKGKAQKEYDEKLDAKLDEIDAETEPDQPETVIITPPKEILQKSLRARQMKAHAEKQQQAREKQRQHLLRAREAKRKAQKLQTSAAKAQPYVRAKAEAELEIIPEKPKSIIKDINQPQTIRDAIVLSEIIGKPRSLNQWQY